MTFLRFWSWVFSLGFLRLHFGGDSSSSSLNQQIYNDNRTISSTDSHNYTDASSTSTSYTDARTTSNAYSNADSHNTSDSGNTFINWTGTDQGAQHLADLSTQLASTVTMSGLDAASVMAGLAGHIGDTSANLAALDASNSMRLSTHMLDLTGELIDKVATGTQSMVASQEAAGQAAASVITAANKTAASTSDSMKTQILAGLAVLVIAAFMHRA